MPENNCEICGHGHETRHCDLHLCGRCDETIDNCDCEDAILEMTAEEWLSARRANQEK
jgi:hypothetical protein